MGNQYSITVSDESANILNYIKKHGKMPSRAIDCAIRTIGIQGLMRLMLLQTSLEDTFWNSTITEVEE